MNTPDILSQEYFDSLKWKPQRELYSKFIHMLLYDEAQEENRKMSTILEEHKKIGELTPEKQGYLTNLRETLNSRWISFDSREAERFQVLYWKFLTDPGATESYGKGIKFTGPWIGEELDRMFGEIDFDFLEGVNPLDLSAISNAKTDFDIRETKILLVSESGQGLNWEIIDYSSSWYSMSIKTKIWIQWEEDFKLVGKLHSGFLSDTRIGSEILFIFQEL